MAGLGKPRFESTTAIMPSRPALLANHIVMHTTDPDHARHRLTSGFAVTSFDLPSKDRGFEARVGHLQIGEVGLYYCDYADRVSLGFGEVPLVRQIFNVSGSASYSGDAQEDIAEGAYSSVLQSHSALKFEFSPNYRHLVLRIEEDALHRHLSSLLGLEIGNLIFHDSVGNPPMMQRLQRLVFQFARDFDGLAGRFSPLAAAEITRGMIMDFLISHAHNFSHLLFRTPPVAHVSATRRVEEFIEANWDKPLDIEHLSTVAQVSARTLFRQFKKDRGCSPAEFVRRIRLDRARNMLEAAIESTSVTQVALRCGFQNMGHFARDFRLAFGELPSETLRRALRTS